MKNFSAKCMGKNKSDQIQRKTSRTKPVPYPMIQLVIVIESRKEKSQTHEELEEKTGLQSHNQISNMTTLRFYRNR